MAKTYIRQEGQWQEAEKINDSYVADMDETIMGQDCGLVTASGGPCPIIAILNRERQSAAVIHVLGPLVEQDEHPYILDLEQIAARDPELFDGAEAVVCMDIDIGLDGNSSPEARRSYGRKALRRVKKLIPNTHQVMRGLGKTVMLDTGNSAIVVFDENNTVLFSSVA
jgi:hypothetical protein